MPCQFWTECALYRRLVESFLVKSGCAISRTCGEKRPEQGSLLRITIRESLIPDVESSFLGFTDVQVTSNNPKCFRVAGPMRSNQAKSFTKASQGQVGLEVDIDHDKDRTTRMSGHNVITALACDPMCKNCSIRQEALTNADGRSACTYIASIRMCQIAGIVGPVPE